MTEKEYIEREAMLEQLRKRECDCELLPIIFDAPAADVAPVKHGKWKVGYFHDRVCSCCTHPSNNLDDYPYKFCPHCGARMDGGNNNDR